MTRLSPRTPAIRTVPLLVMVAVMVVATASLSMAGAVAAPLPMAQGKTVVRRFALITGASQGGRDRVPLRFAGSDARAMRHVLSDLGGLGETETLLLLDVGRAGMRTGFQRIKEMIAASQVPGARTEMIFYYSGHSDESGLLLGHERISYAEVRAWVDETSADVRIAVLDSCASGAMTRGKGGVHRPPFLVDTSSAARGHAYLTASAENEAAQESDRLGAAYFTHYLVSGLRGAADVSHDGRVTLSEAYQYAFTETLARTEASRGGPQHASYDFQLAGKGDLVMTDLRGTSASLLLPAELSGRLFVRDAQGQLVAEVHKLPAQPIQLGLPPGRYRVTLDDNRRLSETTIELNAGKQTTLATDSMVALVPAGDAAKGTTASSPAPDSTADPGLSITTGPSPSPAPPLSALNLSLVPPLDTNAGVPSHNRLVIGLLARSARLTGLSLSVGHYVDGEVRGVQLGGVGAINRGELTGVRLAGALGYTDGPLRGLQMAGVAAGAGGGRGAQIAGALNLLSGSFSGLQLTGGMNVARGELQGLQIAGAINIARQLTGGQLSVVNIADEVRGGQLGVVNIARKVRGGQVGVVNIADTVDGASLGLVTLVRDGIHQLDVSTSEVGATVLSTVLGSRHVYTRLGFGVLGGADSVPGGRAVVSGSPAASGHYLVQWGFGGRRHINERWFLDGELVATQYHRSSGWQPEDAITGSARLLAGVRLVDSFCLVFGPTFNTSVGWNGTDLVTGSGFAESVSRSGQTVVRLYPGAMLGVRIEPQLAGRGMNSSSSPGTSGNGPPDSPRRSRQSSRAC